jgi:hypothetical protein
MQYIGTRQGVMLKPIMFTNQESLLEYLSHDLIDILLISPEMMSAELSEERIGRTILLSSGIISSGYMEYPSVYKYQSSEEILKEVLNYYEEVTNEERIIVAPKEHSEIIGVYSPVWQVGQTTVALVMGQILSEDYSVLYISMEEFSALEKIFHTIYTRDLSDLMYFFKQNPETLSKKLPAVVSRFHGLDYIPPLLYSEDLRHIKTEEWIGLIRKIADIGIYDKIIIDISSMVEDVFKILSICTICYMPINSQWISLMKVSVYEEYLLKSDREDILNKTRKVNIPEIDTDRVDEHYLEQQIWGPLGNYVRKILKEEM